MSGMMSRTSAWAATCSDEIQVDERRMMSPYTTIALTFSCFCCECRVCKGNHDMMCLNSHVSHRHMHGWDAKHTAQPFLNPQPDDCMTQLKRMILTVETDMNVDVFAVASKDGQLIQAKALYLVRNQLCS